MNKIRILSLILMITMILSVLASCKKDKTTGENTIDSVANTENENPGRTDTDEVLDVEDDLPETLDLNEREFNILYRVESNLKNNEFTAEGESSSNIDQAVYRRNMAIEDRLNCFINPIGVVGTMDNIDEVNNKVYQSELQGGKEYDIAAAMTSSMVTLATQGCLTNLNSLNYFNADKDYWSQGFREALSVGEAQYFVTGPMSLSYYRYMFVTLFNQDLFRDTGVTSLYDTVNAGDWTLEKMAEVANNFYFDFNGDSQRDKGDSYGYYAHTGSSSSMMDGFWECFELRIVQKDEVAGFGENYYTYEFEGEKFVSAVDGVINLLKAEGSYSGDDITDNDVYKAFASGQVAMTTVRLNTVENSAIREMVDGYGIVPLPKRDSTQADYATSIQAECLLFCVPYNVDDADQIAAFLEAYASTSYKYVKNAYYDVALTGRYAKDPESVKMLDRIARSVFVDPINYYRTFSFNRESIRGMYLNLTNTIGSTIPRYRTAIKEAIDETNQFYYDVLRAHEAA